MSTVASTHRLRQLSLVTACLIGVLQAAAFAPFNVAGFAWITPGLLLITSLASPGNSPFRLGYLSGLFFWLSTLYWLLYIPVTGGPIAGWLVLSAYLAIYTGVWLWGMKQIYMWFSKDVLEGHSGPALNDFSLFFKIISSVPVWKRVLLALSGAIFWAALEMVRARLITGFPWNFLGTSQYTLIPLIQISSVTGVYGISFVIVWFSIALLLSFCRLIAYPRQQWFWIGELWMPVITIALCWFWGLAQMSPTLKSETRFVKIALIQPSIPQTLIWDPEETTNRFLKLIELSTEALSNKIDLLIWPEAAVPNVVRYDPDITFPAITNLVQKHKTWLIMGADDADPDVKNQSFTFYNSSFLVNPEGEFVKSYRKRRLVMFGEYVPFQPYLPFLKWFTPTSVNFQPGEKPVSFALEDLGVNTSLLICFEDVFPHQVREHVQGDTTFLVNLTNNGWFKESAAQWQHAINALFRAIENGVSMVRCANNGLTCWIDVHGRIRDPWIDLKGTIYGPGYKIIHLELPSLSAPKRTTFYHQKGDVFGWSCVLWSCLIICLMMWIKKPFRFPERLHQRLE